MFKHKADIFKLNDEDEQYNGPLKTEHGANLKFDALHTEEKCLQNIIILDKKLPRGPKPFQRKVYYSERE